MENVIIKDKYELLPEMAKALAVLPDDQAVAAANHVMGLIMGLKLAETSKKAS